MSANGGQLPLCVAYLQALAVPATALIGACIAAIGARIAARQMLIADERLRYDRRYDKRLALYEATSTFVSKIRQQQMSEEDISAYGLRALEARFLFDDEMKVYRYLRDIHQHVALWHHAKERADQMPAGAERDAFKQIERENLNWLVREGDEQTGYAVKFIPHLVQQPLKRSWLLRRPSPWADR